MTTKVHVDLKQAHMPVHVLVEDKMTDGTWKEVNRYTLVGDEQHAHEYVHSHRRLVIEEAQTSQV